MATDNSVYLPPYSATSIYFLKELMNGSRKMLRTTNVRTIHIPQSVFINFHNFKIPIINQQANNYSYLFKHYRFEGLTIFDIRNYLDQNHPEVYLYLPEPNLELPKVPK